MEGEGEVEGKVEVYSLLFTSTSTSYFNFRLRTSIFIIPYSKAIFAIPYSKGTCVG